MGDGADEVEVANMVDLSPSWTAICTLHGLTATLGERTLAATLRSATIGTSCDVVAVQILIGQSVADWQKQGARAG